MKDYELIIHATDDNIRFTVRDKSRFEDLKFTLIAAQLALLAYWVSLLVGTSFSDIWSNFPAIWTDFHPIWGNFHPISTNSSLNGPMVWSLLLLVTIVLTATYQTRQDSMIVMKSIGIQLEYRSRWKFLKNSNKNTFIPLNNIIDLVIHEGFYGYGQVIYYMCVLTKTNPNSTDNDMIKVVFSELLPRKDLLVTVWKQSRQILFNNGTRHWRRVPGQGLRPVS